MKVSELSDEQLSRWIAEKLELEPDYRPVITGSISGIQIYTDRPTITVAWQYKFKYTRVPSQMSNEALESGAIQEEIGSWQPRDMVNDPAMTVMLLEKAQESTELLGGEVLLIGLEPGVFKARFNGHIAFGKLGRAVAEAFALSQGYTEGSL